MFDLCDEDNGLHFSSSLQLDYCTKGIWKYLVKTLNSWVTLKKQYMWQGQDDTLILDHTASVSKQDFFAERGDKSVKKNWKTTCISSNVNKTKLKKLSQPDCEWQKQKKQLIIFFLVYKTWSMILPVNKAWKLFSSTK